MRGTGLWANHGLVTSCLYKMWGFPWFPVKDIQEKKINDIWFLDDPYGFKRTSPYGFLSHRGTSLNHHPYWWIFPY